MVSGSWFNPDGLYIQYGTSKAVPDLGGEYLVYGQTRLVEVYISLASTTFGNPASNTNPVTVGPLPSTFTGSSTAAGAALSAGIQTINTFLPLQTIAPVLTASSGSSTGNLINQEQMWLDQVEVLTLIGATAPTASGLTGVGLVFPVTQQMTAATGLTNPGYSQFVQVTPNASTQLLGFTSNATMSAGTKYIMLPNGSAGNAMISAQSVGTLTATGSVPTGGLWGGNWPLVTNISTNPTWTSPQNPTGLPPWAYISAIASTAQYTGSIAAGLLKLRVYWTKYGSINQ